MLELSTGGDEEAAAGEGDGNIRLTRGGRKNRRELARSHLLPFLITYCALLLNRDTLRAVVRNPGDPNLKRSI